MLPELFELLSLVPKPRRSGWIVCPEATEFEFCGAADAFHPSDSDLKFLLARYRNTAIARACRVSEAAVRKWRKTLNLVTLEQDYVVPDELVQTMSRRAKRGAAEPCRNHTSRMTKERVSRVSAKTGKEAGIIVQLEDPRQNKREKFASAHDIRRGVAQRLINNGVSAETLKVVMRHKEFATTERHYGATRSALSAAAEIAARVSPADGKSELVGGQEKTPQLSAEELVVLKTLLAKL